ncbi:MAG TPA: hypothetical protein VEA19_05330 [Actinomycetota bacterium]|nr:hypothetical protein [Actinomycetota bacterium]
MNRTERKLFRINEQLDELRQEERLVAGELEMHRHLNADAQRDAAVYDTPVERLNAHDTSVDVDRFERALVKLRSQIVRLEADRDKLLLRLGHL